MCVIVAVAVAPCQCFTPGGIQTTLPAYLTSGSKFSNSQTSELLSPAA